MTTSPLNQDSIAALQDLIDLGIPDVQEDQSRDETPEWLVNKFEEMAKQERNIPFTSEEVSKLPIGFTETSVFPTKKFQPNRGKYISYHKWNHLGTPWFTLSIMKELNL